MKEAASGKRLRPALEDASCRLCRSVPLCARGLRLGRAGPSATRAGENG